MEAITDERPAADLGQLAGEFEAYRPHLRAVAYGMLGSRTEADDAVQESWIRLARADANPIEDLRAWLTTVVGRICLDMLRARRNRREDFPDTWLPEPIVRDENADDPEQRAVESDSLGIALLVVLESLNPAERLAFVLHDVFAVPFDDVARIVGRSPQATRQLASRARRRVQAAPRPEGDLRRQRRVVDAFLAAARDGDFGSLLAALDPTVTFQLDTGRSRVPSVQLAGAEAVGRFMMGNARRFLPLITPVTVNGGAGTLAGDIDRPVGVAAFTVVDDRIVRIDVISDPDKLRNLGVD